ncbi:windei [Carabus blaptoides fortunei]
MTGNNNFDADGNRELMLELIEAIETGYIGNSATDSDISQPICSNEMDIRTYFENKLREASGLSRTQLEELAMRSMCILPKQNIIANALVRKVDEQMQDFAILKQNYKDLEIELDSIEQKIACSLATIQNLNNIQIDRRNSRAVATQVNEDDVSPSPDQATITVDSEQELFAEDKPDANEDTALVVEETATNEALSSNESPKSDVQQIVNTTLLPELPIILGTEVLIKPVAPAPQIKVHLLNDYVALTWSMLEEDLSAYEPIHSYQVYCCKETNTPPTPANWCKLIELSADPLPMTCIVEQCSVGKYYFAVRGIDVQNRVGPFSSPIPVIFDVCVI